MKIQKSLTLEEYKKWILANPTLKHFSVMECNSKIVYIAYDPLEKTT